jgi:hypothetical protein
MRPIPLLTAVAYFAAILGVALPMSIYATAANMQKVDLRSFFHGEPPAPPKAPPPKHLAVVATAPGVASDPQIEGFLRAFAAALKARDGKAMLARLSDKYSIDGLPEGKKPSEFFEQAVERIAGPTEMIIKAVETSNNIRTAQVAVHYGPDLVKARVFRFDPQGRLLWSDLFRLQTQTHGA